MRNFKKADYNIDMVYIIERLTPIYNIIFLNALSPS